MQHLSTSSNLSHGSKSRTFAMADNADIQNPAKWQGNRNLGPPISKQNTPTSGVLKHLASYPQPPVTTIGDFKNPSPGGAIKHAPPPLATSSLKSPAALGTQSPENSSPKDFELPRFNVQRGAAKFPSSTQDNAANKILQQNSVSK